jgi:hypothetical protein
LNPSLSGELNMGAYWLIFPTAEAGCVEAESEGEANIIGQKERGEPPKTIKILPYPADQRIGKRTGTPSFCFQPDKCQGRSSCPRRISCVE